MKRMAVLLIWVLILPCVAAAQTAQSTLQGTVRDATGAAVPGAAVIVTHVSTGVAVRGETTAEGRYLFPYLLPGDYRLSVEKSGFRRFVQEEIRLDVQQVRSVDVELTIGDISTSVEVRGGAAPLSTDSSTVSTTVENKLITDLPVIGRSVLDLANLLPGVLPGQGTAGSGNAYGPTIGGGRTGSGDIRVDGTTMMVTDANSGILIMAGSLPNLEAIQEFTVVVNALAAEYGRSGSGALLFATKMGGNKLRGSLFEFFRNNKLNANDFFSNRAGSSLTPFNSHQFGFTLGGPIRIPKVYDGRRRSFFFADYQGVRSRSPSDFLGTVPPASWKRGDYSDLRTAAGALITIFDPLTITTQPDRDGNYLRQPFPGNLIPANRFDLVGKNLVSYYPEPNAAPWNVYTQLNNFFRPGVSKGVSDNFTLRLDHNFAATWRSCWRLTRAGSVSDPPNVFGNPGTPLGRGYQTAPKSSVSWNNVYTLGATTFFEVTYGLSRFSNTTTPPSAGFDLTTLGFPAYFQAQASKDIYTRFPRVDIRNLTSLGQQSAAGIRFTPTTHNVSGSITKAQDRHTIKSGVEYRKFLLNFWQENNPGGIFSFSENWTQRNPVRNVATEGFGLASLLLGLGGGSHSNNISQALASSYWGGFIQDDFRISQRWMINIGVRYEVDIPRTERYNRMSYWDAAAPSPIAGKVAAFPDLKGVMRFVDAKNRRQTPTDKNNWSPRFGFVYRLRTDMVVRGGYAYMYAPSITQATYGNGGFQGFRCTTNVIISVDDRTPSHYLRDPFPEGFCTADGPKDGPFSGPNTALGLAINESWFIDYVNPNVQQWSFNIQRRFPGRMIVEAGYLGNKGNHLIDGGRSAYNQLPPEYLALGNALNSSVANPFRGVITDPTSALSRATVARRQILAPYPQYTAVDAVARPIGNSLYHGFILRVERRFFRGLGFMVSYTAGKEITDSGWGNTITSINTSTPRQNVYDRKSNRALSTDDVSSRLVISVNAEAPFGRGRRFLRSLPPAANAALGGWQVSGIVTLQSGLPVTLFSAVNQTGLGSAAQRPNNNGQTANLAGMSRTIDEKIEKWFEPSVFSIAPPFTFGNAPTVLPDVRNPGIRNCNLSLLKNFDIIPEKNLKGQLRLEASNAFNTTQLGRPGSTVGTASLGVISSVGVRPRSVQLALRILF